MLLRKILEFSFEFSFVIIFITIFFFTIGIILEHDSINSQLDNMVNHMYNSVITQPIDIITSDKKTLIKNIIANLNEPSNENNYRLVRNFIIIMSILFLTIVVLLIKYKYKYKINVTRLLLENIVLFIFVGSFEYIFFSNYVSKYIPVLPSEIDSELPRKINQKLQKTLGIDTSQISKVLYSLGLSS